MVVVIGPQVVLNNAFLVKNTKTFLETNELRQFCSILYDKITGSKNGCKYVLFRVTRKDIEKFCDKNNRFVKGIDKIFCMGKVSDEEAESINSKYDSNIQALIKEARDMFASL